MRRWIKAGFLLGCVSLLLIGCGGETQDETETRSAEQIQKGQRQGEDTESVQEWTLDAPYVQAYYAFLQEYISGREAAAECEDRFSLLFIDDDDIPELLILQDNDSGTTGAKVYTYCEEQVTEVGEYGYGHYGKMLCRERSGVVIDYFDGDGQDDGKHFYFYKIESGKSKEIGHLLSGGNYSEEDAEYTPFFEIDGVPVQRDIYEAKWNELSDNQEDIWMCGKRYPLKEAELLPSFAQAIEDICLSLDIENLLWKRDSEPVLEQVTRQAEVLAAYEILLNELALVWSDTGRFTLIYLDNDDIPELVFIGGVAHLATVDVYTYDQGEPVLVENYGSEASTTYDTCTPIKDVNIGEALREELQTLILTQYDTLKRNVLIKSGVDEDAILLMDYDDYDDDGIYEAFVFCGKSYYDYFGDTHYSGDFWFVGADRCMRLPDRFRCDLYRKIDGQMVFSSMGHEQKYLYYYSAYCDTANISGIWTVENGKPVAVNLPQSGQVVYRGDSREFELWADGYNHYYEPDNDLWTGHTYRPYFYHYNGEKGQLEPDEREYLSRKELAKICRFDLAAEVEAEGYEVTAIVRWEPSDIVTINYTIPPDEYGTITYENIIWDCKAKDYWRGAERGITSWKYAGEGGSI